MTADALDKLKKCREDFEFFAKTCLKIRDKAGQVVPLHLNRAQQIVHERLERQHRETGQVRALILKARQQGISTYLGARFYHRSTLWKGVNTYILTHSQDASDNLFGFVDMYQRHNPLAPHIGVANVKTLEFDKLLSTYTVATAGSKAGGRGRSLTLFHGSEVAFWPNAKDHFAASVQAVPFLPGTEIVMETTAAGPQGEFYDRWQRAIAGIGDYIAIFLPWFESPEYARVPEEGFELSPEPEEGELSEVEYAEMFKLSLAQMCWRRNKIFELGSHGRFKAEYPATAEEAFVAADKNSYIDPLSVLRARKRKVEAGGPLILGVDPAGAGGDRFAVAFRRGTKVEKVIYRDKIDASEALAWLKGLIDEHKPAKMFLDTGGLGAPILTLLRSAGPRYAQIATGVNFGARSESKNAKPNVAGPKNRRAEMWMRVKMWLNQADEPVQIPDDDAIQSDLTSVWVLNDLNNDLQLSSKEQMKAKGIRSPDLGDAIALTFASSVWVAPSKDAPSDPRSAAPMDSAGAKHYGYSVPPFRQRGGPMSWMG